MRLLSQDDIDSDFVLVGLSFVCHSKEWILDYGCTYHTCHNRDLFYSFEELNCGIVFNGHACEILGIGKIKFCMMDPLSICLMFGMSQN